MARECCICDSLFGCNHIIRGNYCELCDQWDDCWIDLHRYKDILKTHGYCPKCGLALMQNIERRKQSKKVEIERRK